MFEQDSLLKTQVIFMKGRFFRYFKSCFPQILIGSCLNAFASDLNTRHVQNYIVMCFLTLLALYYLHLIQFLTSSLYFFSVWRIFSSSFLAITTSSVLRLFRSFIFFSAAESLFRLPGGSHV